MNSFVLTALAVTCAGAICALAGDLQKRPALGLICFLCLNFVIWARFFGQMFISPISLLSAIELFLLSQALATLAYLGMTWFLDPERAAFFRPALD